jgi:hypothetical protein
VADRVQRNRALLTNELVTDAVQLFPQRHAALPASGEPAQVGTMRGEPAQRNESESLADSLQNSRVGIFIRARHYASSSTGL